MVVRGVVQSKTGRSATLRRAEVRVQQSHWHWGRVGLRQAGPSALGPERVPGGNTCADVLTACRDGTAHRIDTKQWCGKVCGGCAGDWIWQARRVELGLTLTPSRVPKGQHVGCSACLCPQVQVLLTFKLRELEGISARVPRSGPKQLWRAQTRRSLQRASDHGQRQLA